MNKHKLQGYWKQVKGEIQEEWGELTNDDVAEIDGEFTQLVGKLQVRYGIAVEEAEKQAREWMEKNPNIDTDDYDD